VLLNLVNCALFCVFDGYSVEGCGVLAWVLVNLVNSQVFLCFDAF
jgi:hypothetical protein